MEITVQCGFNFIGAWDTCRILRLKFNEERRCVPQAIKIVASLEVLQISTFSTHMGKNCAS
jgi:hypothetical protein